ncbi:thiamine-phosphate kinase [Heliobacterium chlorum]|uniref:Thiamine-monophosphate kinase n=2 Tax=Heliobacterium chlorum TaxID=2698 RepID=A0ABR7T4J8_HELCL|nr:thiamine-phosphate kinase [Heliobacterium chlorum]MBC9784601.1 thiamine-phosphate kinase [Heliobacterium chlorum]
MNEGNKGTSLSEVGEFGLIARLAAAWQRGAQKPSEQNLPGLRLGIGDDAAVIRMQAGGDLLVTTDMLVEDVHFLWLPHRLRQLGRKALAVNISDIAAMGGKPGWAFLSIGVPAKATVEEVEKIYSGMGEMAACHGVTLAGGDTVRADKWVINVTLLGVAGQEPFTRSGGRPGDAIVVTGTVGDSAAGLHLLFSGEGEKSEDDLPEDWRMLISRHLDPTPRVKEALVVAELGGVTAMMDVSDGVSSEVNHICKASGCGARIDLASLPISLAAQRLTESCGRSVFPWALSGGEDYELIFTVSPEKVSSLMASARKKTGTDFTVIGHLTEPGDGITAVHPDINDGAPFPLTAKGYNHFASSHRDP